jgi:hypothetical protein
MIQDLTYHIKIGIIVIFTTQLIGIIEFVVKFFPVVFVDDGHGFV